MMVLNFNDLPDGEYAFLESYCNEVDCDCRRVMINVISRKKRNKIFAVINYGRESAGFYRGRTGDKDMKGPFLDPLNKQTKYAPALLDVFESVLQDKDYVSRLRKHYKMFKQAIKKNYNSRIKSKGKLKRKIGRNDPCPCGSGKKYKKCCGRFSGIGHSGSHFVPKTPFGRF